MGIKITIFLMIFTYLFFPCKYYAIEAYAAKTNTFTDKSALLALKSAINDPQNLLESSWSSNTSMCQWIGVTCGARHRRVRVLNLSNMSLTGTVPPHIGNLSFLVTLNFSNNYFHGSLPVELSRLHRLEKISMDRNNLTGEIPSWLGSLSELQYLYLNDNEFVGPIPISIFNLTSLQVISLYMNKFSGDFFPYFLVIV
ncbi:putative receptor-like protein kinase At3g47110 [Humulus lupulus]|uniref:putative receptor-like protein kinase At3g47110 n=1 Tax=Humulus lupulus TaxID=3486 RepID=UPI002B40EC92|nr:putative receptor-like protein kinase At3g47110 [Humulus lupulus]